MDSRIQELIDMTRIKFGLGDCHLQRHRFSRYINNFNETVYTFCMEWFPNHVTGQEDDGSNRAGTASIEINVKSRKFESVIFVMGKTYAENGIMFANHNTEDIIKWVDGETGLTYGEHFQIHKEEAFEKTKEWFELKPYYVYDFEQKQYVLCGKLDCQYGVDASNGDVVALDDL